MRQRAALIFTILLGAVWAAGPSPVAAQTPPPHVELPEKKPKPEKPEVPNGPKVPSAPEAPEPPPPEPPPPPESEPPPPAGEEPPPTDDGGTGAGGGSTGDGSEDGTQARASGGARDPSPSTAGLTAAGDEPGETQASREFSRVFGSIAPRAAAEIVSREALDTFRAGPTSAGPHRPTRTAADDGALGVGGLPLALLAAGLVLVSIGIAVGVVRARGAGQWRPPGSHPEST